MKTSNDGRNRAGTRTDIAAAHTKTKNPASKRWAAPAASAADNNHTTSSLSQPHNPVGVFDYCGPPPGEPPSDDSEYSTTRFFPSRLARYMATSAWANNSSGVRAVSG